MFYLVHEFNLLPLPLNTLISVILILGSRLWGYENNIHMPRFHR